MENNKKALIFLFGIIIVFDAVLCLALYKYDQAQIEALQPAVTTQKQISSLKDANTTLRAQNEVLAAKNTEQQNEKQHFCDTLAKAKIAEPLCTPGKE